MSGILLNLLFLKQSSGVLIFYDVTVDLVI